VRHKRGVRDRGPKGIADLPPSLEVSARAQRR